MLSRHVVAPFHLRGMPGQSDEPHVAKQRASEATAGATGLDLTYLEEITDNDAPLMAEMLEAYTNVAEEFLSKMAQGASGNGKALAATAHKLKGAIAMPGLFHLATALEAFEKQALTGSHWNVLQAKGQPLADEIEANLVAVKQWLEKVQTV